MQNLLESASNGILIYTIRTCFLCISGNFPAEIYLLKVNNRNTRKICEISPNSKWRCSQRCRFGVFIVNFEHISHILHFEQVNASLISTATAPRSNYKEKSNTVNLLTTTIDPAFIYLLKVNKRNTRRRCEICSKLTIKIPERRQWCCSGIFIVNFEHISHLLVFLLLTLSR